MADDRSTRVFRSTPARVLGWAWLAFAALNVADIVWRGHDLAAVVAAAVLLFASGCAYVAALRPRIVADRAGVRFHNPLRDVHLPWAAISKIDATDAVRVHCGDSGAYRAWAMQTSPRAKARAQSRRATAGMPDDVATYVMNRTPTDYAAEQLTELADAH